MKRKFRLKQILAMILITAQLVSCLSGCGLKKKDNQNQEATVTEVSGEPTYAPGDQFTVSFGMPDNSSASEQEKTTLPVPGTVDGGTLVGTLPSSERVGNIFLGYSYDAAGKNVANDDDVIAQDTTLYPIFKEKEGFDSIYDMNYVATNDAPDNITFELSTYGIGEAAVRERITVRDLTLNEDVPYVLTEKERTWKDLLELTPRQMNMIDEVVDANLLDPEETDMVAAMEALELDYNTMLSLILIYAPEELEVFSEKYAGTDQDLLTIGYSTEKELKNLYELGEGESLELYWRKDLGMDVEEVLRLSDIVKANSVFTETLRYTLSPEEGTWNQGDLFQIEILDTERTRFVYEGEICTEYILFYNFQTALEEVENMTVNDDVIFLNVSEVSGVTPGSMFSVTVDENGEQVATQNQVGGVMTYNGSEKIGVGSIVAVYDGTLNADKSVDGLVGYYEITEVQGGGNYVYQGADFQDVIALPKVIPVPADGSYDDGKISIRKSDLIIPGEIGEMLNMQKGTTVEVGDFLAFYTGTFRNQDAMESAGYGRVTGVTSTTSGYEVTYDPAEPEDIIAFSDLAMSMGEVAPTVSDADAEAVKTSMLEELERSHLVEEASDYLCEAILSDEADLSKYQNRDKLESMMFKTAEGEDITLAEVRALAEGGSKVEVGDVNVSFLLGLALQHFEGRTGLRAEVTVSLTIKIKLNDNNIIEITPMFIFEQECLLATTISVKARYGWVLFIPVLYYIDIDPSFECGTYTGLGLMVTIQTKEDDEETPFGEMCEEFNQAGGKGEDERKQAINGLIKSGETLQMLADLQKGGGAQWEGGEKKEGQESEDEFKSPGLGGSLPDKYSAMLSNDAEYVDLVNLEIGTFAAPVDPFHLVEFSIGAYFVVSMKINAMIGTGITYENAKVYSYHIRRHIVMQGEDIKESSQADLKTPNFRADFYAFGMIGVRAGLRLDVRLGIISTKLASIGVTGEAGLYAELYGFLYVWYEWTSGQGSTSGAMGSLLFEIGVYVEINFKAQLFDGRFEKEIELYSNTWPLVQLGAEAVPLDFSIEKNSEDLEIEYEEGTNLAKLPDELYNINMMDMKSGEVEEESMDDTASAGEGATFTMRGRTYTQYDEEHFSIECYDTNKEGKRTGTCSFIYLPATNEVMIKPADSLATEVYGEVTLTYKNDTFGFNTMAIERTVKLHWEGSAASASVEYYCEKEPGSGEYELVEIGEFDGFNGIEYDLVVDDDFTFKYDGYRLENVEFADLPKLRERYYELLDEYSAKVLHYQKTGEGYDEAAELGKNLDAAWENYNNYGYNLKDTIRDGKGTLYFMMASADTLVKVYYKHITHNVVWTLWGDDQCRRIGCMLGIGTIKDVAEGDTIDDKIDAARKAMEEYSYAFDYEIEYSEGREGDVKPYESGISMNKDDIYIDIHGTSRDYKVNWVVNGDIIKTDVVGGFRAYRPELPDKSLLKTEGYYIKYWDASAFGQYPDGIYETYGGPVVYDMPGQDVNIVAVLEKLQYKVTWYNDNRILYTAYVPYGEKLKVSRYMPSVSAQNAEIHWMIRGEGEEYELDDAYTMPPMNLDIYMELTPLPYQVTFKDGDKVVGTAEGFEGDIIQIPEYADNWRRDKGYALRWVWRGLYGLSDEYYEPASTFRMRIFNMTLEADWYCVSHRWSGGEVVEEATCVKDGIRRYTCMNCGETRDEVIPATGVHVWGEREYKWASDLSYVTGTVHCTLCGEEHTARSKPATWEKISEYLYRYTAEFEDELFETQVYDLDDSESHRHTVTFKAGGKVVKTFEDVLFGSDVTIPAYDDPTRSRYDMVLTWALEGSGEPPVSYAAGATFQMLDKDMVLNAVWTCRTHTWDQGTVITPATCVADGVTEYTCLACGEVRRETVPATGIHSYGARTYQWEGDLTVVHGSATCTVCGHVHRADSNAVTSASIGGGKVRLTATFSDSVFETQTREIDDNGGLYYADPTNGSSAVIGNSITVTLDTSQYPETTFPLTTVLGDLVLFAYSGAVRYNVYRPATIQERNTPDDPYDIADLIQDGTQTFAVTFERDDYGLPQDLLDRFTATTLNLTITVTASN